ncbi:ribosome biogenesis GTP-binding protein YihA/YsxC [Myxococcus sp. MISCRS1]|uniref:ribosome biogenesis GTP-binding protein YihA/YsxC n=1 Tax=Myxococcus TaxID=32 RepID=UPI0011437402|nr:MULTISPECIES: ribosome biogenesis GTP-binding protein YihA/YsxC [unclassified Myxococcus]MBZ4399951.1 ribosome biogenesis GTP-binding protein YihA/YsxC [Myxococcus sp. AS-1-15]MBZ4414244.1 ribosome biogenesis GTP-binding protein YihA/YsxC [Myxococcus sp. XM-1-1-1]MCY0996007.1 ribosome biogenesis GTP-binding protein YihA/YsxC [Myxococcus sp. MISCRS1]
MIKILDARFVITAVEPKGYPQGHTAEVAFVGRSNVGKSSMINTLTHRKKLVRVSNTPGRTRTLNFFDVDLERGTARYQVRLCDLPGYGFARASKTDKAQWEKMITTYLEKRHRLEVVVSIIDAEVGPTPDDLATLDYLQAHKRKVMVVATKIDRLTKAKTRPRLQELAKLMDLPLEAVLPFSSTERRGVDEVWGALLDTFGRASRVRAEAAQDPD